MAGDDQFGRYRILKLLGRGGMGDVYLAGAQGAAGFEKPVVLKILRPKYGRSGDRIRRLLREAFIGVRLDHQNVVQVFDLGEESGRWYVVMEYVRGFTLAHLIQHAAATGKLLDAQAVATIARAVVDAIDYVHHIEDEAGESLGLIHRDVTPSNVLLGADGRIKLSDFGVAVLSSEDDAGELLAGKPPYLPPEAFERAPAAQGWDLYALGITLYEALAGRRPFLGETLRDVEDAVAKGAEPLERVRPDCPRPLAQLIGQAIHPDPEKRFRAAGAFRAALEGAVPRRVDDLDRHRAMIRLTFGSPGFVERHGLLPTTAGSVDSAQLDPKTPPTLEASGPTIQVSARPPLRFGLSPAHGAGQARAHGDRLSTRLKEVLGREVHPVVVADYRVLVDCLIGGEVDLAWMPPAAFVEAEARGAKALVVAQRCGRVTYESAIIVHADSPLRTLADLRGQSIAWVDRESSSGFLFAVAEIVRELGLPSEVLGTQHFQGSHRAVCEAVANRWAAAGATYAVRDHDGRVLGSGWIDLMGARAGDLRPIAWSVPIPGDNIAYRAQLPAEVAERCGEALMALVEDDEGRLLLRDVFNAEALVRSDVDHYDLVRATLQVAQKAL